MSNPCGTNKISYANVTEACNDVCLVELTWKSVEKCLDDCEKELKTHDSFTMNDTTIWKEADSKTYCSSMQMNIPLCFTYKGSIHCISSERPSHNLPLPDISLIIEKMKGMEWK